jgi:hypothetical protein
MKPLDSQLDRLLRSAARVTPAPVVTELPYPAEARVLAAWRRSRAESPGWLSHWLQAGLAGAALVTAVVLSLSWYQLRAPAGDEFAVANAALYVAVAP